MSRLPPFEDAASDICLLCSVLSIPGDMQVNYRVEVAADDAAVIVLDEAVSVKITLTSPLLRDSSPGDVAASDDGEGDDANLAREPCLRVSNLFESPHETIN